MKNVYFKTEKRAKKLHEVIYAFAHFLFSA